MNHHPLFINQRPIHSGNLQEFTNAWTGDPDLPAFLNSWYDQNDDFPAHTSGSTGQPTEIRLLKKYASASARATIGFLGLEVGDTALLSMPAGFIAGRMMIVRAMEGKLNLIPIPPSSCPEIPDQVINLAAFTPHQFQNILGSTKNYNYKKIKNVLLGGAPVPDEMIQSLADFPGNIFETFGMTETYSHVAVRKRYPVDALFFQSVPPASFSTSEGRLIIEAPHLGIRNLQTNDIVDLEGPDRFRWLGRADFVINSGGLKLHPEILEKKLAGIIYSPYFLTGQPDKVLGEKLVLVVQKDTNIVSENQLISAIDGILDKYEKPKSIVWVDTMIFTPTGKINRKETRKLYRI